MAVQDKDKLVSLEDLKTAYDDLNEDISDVKNTLSNLGLTVVDGKLCAVYNVI